MSERHQPDDRGGRARLPACVAVGIAGILVAVAACGGGQADAAATRDAGTAASERIPAAAPADTVAASRAADADTVGSSGLRVTRLDVGGHPVTAEIAETPEARHRGLMHRDSLPADHGMLFVYPEVQTLSFWMRNTKIGLDIAFVDPSGKIVDIQHMSPESDSLHSSARPAMYALEMASGWFDANGVRVGDVVGF